MEEKDLYTKEDVLEILVEENRKFRQEIMQILYRLIIGLCLTVFTIVLGFVCITHIYFYSPSDFSVEAVTSNVNTNHNTNENIPSNTNEERSDN